MLPPTGGEGLLQQHGAQWIDRRDLFKYVQPPLSPEFNIVLICVRRLESFYSANYCPVNLNDAVKK